MSADYEKKIREINQRLKEYYGGPERPTELTGIEYLVETILSQNTNDINRDKAFKNLKEKHDSWEKVENLDREELIDTIRVAGLGPTKAERIQESLRIVREDQKFSTQGEYSLEFIKDMSIEEGKAWLTEIPGIGPKTAAIILCFHFGKPVMPVDTHVHRISQRLGLVPEGVSRTKSHELLEERVPDDIKYEFHRLLIDHGREHCKAQHATCCEGPLADLCSNCDYFESLEVRKGMILREFMEIDLEGVQNNHESSVKQVASADYNKEQVKAWTSRELEDYMPGNNQIRFVVYKNGELVGHGDFIPSKNELTGLMVHGDYGGEGIGSWILDKIEEEARNHDLKELNCESTITAKGFYEKHGWNTLSESSASMNGEDIKVFNMRKSI